MCMTRVSVDGIQEKEESRDYQKTRRRGGRRGQSAKDKKQSRKIIKINSPTFLSFISFDWVYMLLQPSPDIIAN